MLFMMIVLVKTRKLEIKKENIKEDNVKSNIIELKKEGYKDPKDNNNNIGEVKDFSFLNDL